jgi:hypothetical protein
MFALQNLDKGGLIRANSSSKLVSFGLGRLGATKATNAQWDNIMKTLDIVPLFTDDKRQDPSFVDAGLSALYGGIVPVTVRLVQKAIFPPQDGWLSLETQLRQVPGPLFEAYQPTGRDDDKMLKSVKNVLVMFVGGITWAEISGLRYLVAHHNRTRRAGAAELKMMIGTSRIAGGETLINDLADVHPNMIKNYHLNPGK